MATLDNERYLRHIWLIGEGGLLLLRRIVMKKAGNNRQNLEALLLNHKAEFDNVLREQQQRIFPSQTTVNADVNTWDMSLLLLVLKKMFWHNLSPTDRSGIATIKYHRNHIQGHPLEMSMNASDYETCRQLLEQSFRNLATGVNATAEIDNVIGRTASGNIDVQFALQTIRDMNEFKNSTVCALQESFERVRSEMSQMNDSIEDIKGHVENIGTVQTIQHDELMRSLNEEGQQLKQLLTEMKDNVASLKLMSAEQLEKIERSMKGIHQLKQMILQKEKQRTTEELQTIIQAECADKIKQKEATDLFFKLVKIIQVDNPLSDEEIILVITQRIHWYGELVLELIDDIISWFNDMYALPDAIPGNAQIGSIRIPISCSNISGLLTFLKYMTGSQSKQRLSSLSATISKILLFPCTLVWRIDNMNLQKSLHTPLKTTDVKRIVLPFHITSTKGLTRVVSMFRGEERTSHVEKISETLSKIFNVTLRLETYVDKIQLREIENKEEEPEKDRKRKKCHMVRSYSSDVLLENKEEEEEPEKDRKRKKRHMVRSYSSDVLLEKEHDAVPPSAVEKMWKIGRSHSLEALKARITDEEIPLFEKKW